MVEVTALGLAAGLVVVVVVVAGALTRSANVDGFLGSTMISTYFHTHKKKKSAIEHDEITGPDRGTTYLHGALVNNDTIVLLACDVGVPGLRKFEGCDTAADTIGTIRKAAPFHSSDDFGEVLL